MPLAHVAQLFQYSHLAIAGWKDKGIDSVRDLDGRRVSVWQGPPRLAYRALFRAQRIEPRIVPQYASVQLFLQRGVDACSVTTYNERRSLYLAGVEDDELRILALKDHGIDFPEDGIYCLRRTREEKPDLCRAVAEATIEGWQYAADHIDEAVDIVMARTREAKLATNRPHMSWMLRTVIPSILPAKAAAASGDDMAAGGNGAAAGGASWEPGVLDRKRYEATRRWLLELGEVKSAPEYEDFVR